MILRRNFVIEILNNNIAFFSFRLLLIRNIVIVILNITFFSVYYFIVYLCSLCIMLSIFITIIFIKILNNIAFFPRYILYEIFLPKYFIISLYNTSLQTILHFFQVYDITYKISLSKYLTTVLIFFPVSCSHNED